MRDTRSFVWLTDGLLDARYALRVLRRNPGFTAASVATLALGIGASTAIFSVAYGVAMRPLPYPQADRLVRLYEANPANGQLRHDVSAGAFHEWREVARSIESAALFAKPGTRFLDGPDPAPVRVMSVSPGIFDVLGVALALGSGFKAERSYTRFTADSEVVLSHGAWQRLFAGRPDVIGRTIVFSGVGDPDVYRVVGVMPAGFAFAEPVDLWKPSLVVDLPINRLLRQWRYDRAIARLRPGASIEQARAELESVSVRLGREFPTTNAGWTVTIESLHDSIVGTFGRATWLLLAAVGVVLLVACLNVGGLLVARAVARERETAVRVAIGAGTWRLVRLWLVEAILLGGAGAAAGLALASLGLDALTSAAPPGIPRLDAVALDRPVLAAAASCTLLAVAIAALAPLSVARRRDLIGGMRGGASAGPARVLARGALTVAQCAGAAALVVLAVMLTRSFMKLTTVDLGWEPDGAISMWASPPTPPELRRPWALLVDWSDRAIARLETTPGLRRAAITSQIPLSPQSYPATLARGRGRQDGDAARWPGVQHSVSDGYFEAMGIRLVDGRVFDARDRFTAAQLVGAAPRPERGVAVVSAAAARLLWPDRAAVGQVLWLPDIDNVTARDVIGVVEDIHFYAVGESPVAHVFVPWTQFPTGSPKVVARGDRTGAALAPIVRSVLQAVEPGTRIDQVVALDALAARATAQPRFTSRIVALFGTLALLLAAVGIHGTLAYLVRARAREIGIRLALGASQRNILSRTLASGLVPASIGVAGGLALAFALARTFRALLFDVAPLDAGAFASGAALLMVTAAVAALGPARAAARVNPATTLRAE